MKCIAKCNSYMEDGNGGYDREAQWLTKGKVYYLLSKTEGNFVDSNLIQFIDDADQIHYIPTYEVKKYFNIIYGDSDDIKLITKDEAKALVASGQNCNEYEPWGLFYQITTDRYGNTIYVAYDNSDGHCWVEEFYSIGSCMAWLRGEKYD